MKTYRVDQVVNGKTYQGGRIYRTIKIAQNTAAAQTGADNITGDSQISYIVVEVTNA